MLAKQFESSEELVYFSFGIWLGGNAGGPVLRLLHPQVMSNV